MLKVEFDVEPKKPVSHVGLYKARNIDIIVLFANEQNKTEGTIIQSSNKTWAVGGVCKDFVSACIVTGKQIGRAHV